MRDRVFILVALVCGIGLSGAEILRAAPFAPRLGLAMGTLGSLSAVPTTITFRATNPDLGVVSGSSPGSVSWMLLSGSVLKNWTLSVQAGSAAFLGCQSIPTSAVRVICSAASVSGGGGTGGCSSSLTLSTSAQQVAGGIEGDSTRSYSVSISFTLAESWRYIASSACPIIITYTVNAP